jgi:hypothetical protein
MLETAGHVIASDSGVPDLSPDFTARVMQAVGQPAVTVIRFPTTRVAVLAAAIVQVAAIVALAVLWQFGPTTSAPAVPAPPLAETTLATGEQPNRDTVYRSIVEGLEDHFWEMHAAGRQLTTDVLQLARYLDITVPDQVVQESAKVAEVNPWQALWDTLEPRETDEAAPAASDDEIRSI